MATPSASHRHAEGTPNPPSAPAIRLIGISKWYRSVRANHEIDLTVEAGTIHGLLGENGAGKSTLMKVLFGLISSDAGTVEVAGEGVVLRSPADALRAGIGMVQQHFSLIADFTVVENLVLGDEPRRGRWRLDLAGATTRIAELSERYGFRIDPERRIGDLAVGARQRVEILKALFRGANVLILDEPTAALAPQESRELFAVLTALRQQGRTVIFISHKLPEVIELCDRVTVLRDGEVIGLREISPADRVPGQGRTDLEAELATMMVGRALPSPPERTGSAGRPILTMAGAGDGDGLGPLDLEVKGGEILGVAGVEGNGQTELVELLLGVRPCVQGRLTLDGNDITTMSVAKRLRSGVAHIAEDRHAAGLAMRMSLIDNAALGFQGQAPFARRQYWLSGRNMALFARSLIRRFGIRSASVAVPARSLSGGNQQKLVVGRELARKPLLMIATQPTRGLDVGAAAFVHQELSALRADGYAVLLISLDLSEILALADRLVVLSQGQVVGTATPGDVDVETIGTWMTASRTAAAHP
jgi:ABC-type uncharacterized transport system ATPase subunit